MHHGGIRAAGCARGHQSSFVSKAPPRAFRIAWTALLFASATAGITDGCSAVGEKRNPIVLGSGGATAASSTSAASAGGAGGTGGVTLTATTTGSGGTGGISLLPDAGDASSDADPDADAGPACGSQCGPTELCDAAHLGYDDNCNGTVDEGCPCNPGQTHWCFKGDPKWRNTPGCFDGTESCTELGTWGPCLGGVHASPPDNCWQNNTSECHAISTTPFGDVHLETGTGTFSNNAVAGSESYTVQCPAGVSQCPAVMGLDDFQPLQSGEYTVTYTKSVAGNPSPLSCTYPLFVGAPGLRVELSWEHFTTDTGVDLDLHLHQPVNTDPWSTNMGVPSSCGWINCKFDSFQPPPKPTAPEWFTTTNAAPQPVNWDLQANMTDNTCYGIPRGVGMQWQQLGMGCHNPRLDIDNIQCNFSVTDPNDPDFCTPENINIDYPPTSQWFRIAVHYYWNHDRTYAVHPEVKVFYNGAQFADLGPQGFYAPTTSPVTFNPSDGAGQGVGNVFWLVADVAVVDDGCGHVTSVVQPLYADPTQLTPLFMIDSQATTTFSPAWPSPPQ